MANPRLIDYDLLKQLLRDHPEWSYHEYARVINEDLHKRDPHARPILPNSIASAISRYRPQWEAGGLTVPDNRLPVYRELIPPAWRLSPRHRMDVRIRKLRTIAALRRGVDVEDPRAERQARQFERDLREQRAVVDVSPRGVPCIRPAKPWELNAQGELLDVVAIPEPSKIITDGQASDLRSDLQLGGQVPL